MNHIDYLIYERIKYNRYHNRNTEIYFWRTYDKQEIDWIESTEGRLQAFEFKWNTKTGKKSKIPGAWAKNYPNASYQVITPDKYLDFIVPR